MSDTSLVCELGSEGTALPLPHWGMQLHGAVPALGLHHLHHRSSPSLGDDAPSDHGKG